LSQKTYHVLNLGAGVQSTALYLMFLRGDLKPQIDAAIFADTQDEPAAVYEHLRWLQSLNGPRIVVGTAGRLGDDLVNGTRAYGAGNNRFATIPAFVADNLHGSPGMQMRQCSKDYKIRVIERTIRREVLGLEAGASPRGVTVHQYIGISLDESGRAGRIAKAQRAKYFRVHFPLVENFMTRANCLTYLADKVPHDTPRSACVYCPYHSDYEWDQIKRNDPEGWTRAVFIDNALRQEGTVSKKGLRGILYVHRSCVPLDLVQLDTSPDPRKAQLAINFSAECMGVCGV